ncbi:hypothetical protein DPMN_186921 [Dreissena polymorpha]|uniref:Uncharacterized protein n=1 Tax=Dreissena polymorpha TaxID=45954 RepID=A0A9D4I8L2_DREPO|nr:hypothetical protein DPMN_186921 [Dreissena polymorpha]
MSRSIRDGGLLGKNEDHYEQNEQYLCRHHHERRETGRSDQLQVLGSIPTKVRLYKSLVVSIRRLLRMSNMENKTYTYVRNMTALLVGLQKLLLATVKRKLPWL